ncbi:type IVB secretion system protein IcmH/DotU [Thalassococcus sp. S3]|uniref:type IVB secretion system protein IcmH/DotU n=1 Tax=Thalassococcus sp. S3 TaxID=2017482 RepID=UPI001023FC06|nr:type IVB secretion system protein IcmH/DotU [Thalassococcus sp. S3]QBF33981.1 hypothetical protein CFI11_22635 [Thalassococcus sp. S3]
MMDEDETILLPREPDTSSPAHPEPLPALHMASAPAEPVQDETWHELNKGRQSPLILAAAPVLTMAAAVKTGATGDDIGALHRRAFAEIDAFEVRAGKLGLAPRALKASKYALCATLDDVVMNTPLGSRSIWTSHSLVGSFFSETWGGDRFFDLLDQMKRDPGVNIDLIELLYYCISLGFEGRYRISDRGQGELMVLREDLYRLIRSIRGEPERDLSPVWRGAKPDRRSGLVGPPLWATAGIALCGLVALYLALSALLDFRMRETGIRFAEMPPTGFVRLIRESAPQAEPAVVMLPVDRLRRFLEAEIREGLVTVIEDDRSITVTIRGDGMFESGAPDPLAEYGPLMDRIGIALNGETGAVAVIGHTDSIPMRSARFPSNLELSQARADAVATLIREPMERPDRVSTSGRGADEPIAPNTSEAGRRLNRRTEIVLQKEPH